MKTRIFPRVVIPSFLSFAIVLCMSLFSTIKADAQLPDSTTEKKVDYLERIYFSGENKEGLKIKIQIAIQDVQQKAPTASLVKQVTFLLDIQDKANTADNACEILDLLSAGIYKIDAAEASRQGVRPASDKAKAKSADALASLTKLSSTSSTLSTNASNLAWSNYLLNGGKSLTSGAGKIANAAGTLGTVANGAGQAVQTAKQLNDIAKSIGFSFKKKDKACDDVPKKDIEIGEHAIPAINNPGTKTNTQISDNASTITTTTIVNIQAINLSALKTLTDSLRNRKGIKSAEKSYNATTSTITIVHTGTTDTLADWLDDRFKNEFRIVDYTPGKIDMAKK